MKTFLFALLWVIPFYLAGLFGGIWLFPYFSQNSHDVQIEAAMTGAFLFGPISALLGFLAGILFHRSRRRRGN